MNSLKAVHEGCDAFCKGYMDRAILCFESVLLQEHTPTSWYYLGLAQAAVGNDSQAICAFKRSLNLDFAQPEVYMELASSFINEGLYSYACHMLCFWLCVQETHREAVYEKITKQKFGFFSLNKMPKSFVDESDLMNLLHIFSSIASSEMLKEKETEDQVDKYSNAKSLSESREIFQETDFDPANSAALNDANLYTCLALLFIMSNKLKEAHHYLLAAIQVNGKAPKLWNMLGAMLVEEKCYGEAIEAFKHALDIWPGYTKVRINIASLCQRLGLFREAAQHLFQVFLQEEGNSIRSSSWKQLNEIIIEINDPKLLKAWHERDLACLQEYLLM